jgi:hypothetical protein
MMKLKLAVGALVVAGLVGSTFAVNAKSSKHSKQHSSMTTGANTKSSTARSTKGSTAANPASQGNVGPGTTNTPGSTPAR